MNSYLENIQKQIDDAEKQAAELRSSLARQKANLEKAKDTQRDSILQGRGEDTDGAESEIVNLMTRINGTRAAIETMNTTLQQLQTEKKHELNKIRIAQAEQMREDIRGLFKDIYLLLAELINKVKALDTKRVEYKTILKVNDDQSFRKFSERTAHVKILLVSEISNILSGFEYDLFDKSGLPTPEILKKSMR